jgi:hypothetical protein
MKKRILIVILVAISVTIFIICYNTFGRDEGTKLFESTFDQSLPKGLESKEIFNDYSSAPYEGMKLYRFKITDNNINKFNLEVTNSWSKLPLPEELDLVLYGGTNEGTDYTYNFADKTGLPKIEDGYWILKNEHQNILNENSFNFTLAIYDSVNKYLYLFKIDT